MTDASDRWLQRYLAIRGPLEVLFWVLVSVVQVLANTVVVMIDIRRIGLGIETWQVLTWEVTSNLVVLALVPGVIWMLDRMPLRWSLLLRHLPWHVAASLVFSLVHVAGMVALRKIAYAAVGSAYEFGPWLPGLAYEALKDVRGYALIAGTVLAYRLLLWRWQGEARWLDAPDGAATPAPQPAPAEPPPPGESVPERILVKKLGKEFLLATAEIEWVQSCGNYVNLRRQQHDYPLRSTLAAIEQRLDGARFARVHRSYLVNLGLVQVIEPTEAGDARLRLVNGSTIPCSRTHLAALRQRLGASTPALGQPADNRAR